MLRHEVLLLPEEEIIWQDGPASIRGRRFPSQVVFTINGKDVAIFDDGNTFRLMGEVRENVLYENEVPGMLYDEESLSIAITVESGTEQMDMRLTSTGDLLTSHPVITGPVGTDSVDGISITGESVILNTLGGITIFRVDAADPFIRLFGNVRENQL